jgi:hypothetical protein
MGKIISDAILIFFKAIFPKKGPKKSIYNNGIGKFSKVPAKSKMATTYCFQQAPCFATTVG